MKINSISFGQTYINNLSLLSDENRQKLGPVIAIGESYPVDLYLEGKSSRSLKLSLTRANLWEHLFINNAIDPDDKMLPLYNLIRIFDKANKYNHGMEYPMERMVIKNMDNMSQSDVVRKVIDFVYDYNEKYSKLFDN